MSRWQALLPYVSHGFGCRTQRCKNCGYDAWLHDRTMDLDEMTCLQRGLMFQSSTDCTCGLTHTITMLSHGQTQVTT
jgi:hypothetical protein